MAVIRGTSGGDILVGTLNADTIYGFAGDDLITGGRGNDRVFGGDGGEIISDRADGPDGNDFYDGGAGVGTDIVDYGGQTVGLAVTLAAGGAASRVVQGAEVDVIRSIAGVFGSQRADVIIGNELDNDFVGRGGADRLEGRGGNDVLEASSAAGSGASPLLDGGSGNDRLLGGEGVDRLRGGTDADTLLGGRDLAGEPAHLDFLDVGADRQADRAEAAIDLDPFPGGPAYGFGVDRVSNFSGADELLITVAGISDGYTAAASLDSNRSGTINDADRDVRLVGGDLVLDIDASYGRVTGQSLGIGDQHIVLVNTTGFDADQLI